ncbi:uncharacterized protein LOC112050010 isoform X2 [Bicyclus anynana]|nr:uncharacterized protein LOC112050010 isoform X2 [Bicyclus anynana]
MEDSFELIHDNSQNTDNEGTESSHSQQESPLDVTENKKTNIKSRCRKMRRSKTEKFYIEKQKIIDSISPNLLKKALKNILDFLLDESRASSIFTNLAPVEARFLENFLSIYKKRQSFEETLTPACNELMNKMCEFFKEFDKNCRLEVYAAKSRVNASKREVKFIKVPRYTRNNANLQQIYKGEAVLTKTENKQTATLSPNSSQSIQNSGIRITIRNENTNDSDDRQIRVGNLPNTEAKGIIDKDLKDAKGSINGESKSNGVIDKAESTVKEKIAASATTNRSPITNRLNINQDITDCSQEKISNDKKGNQLSTSDLNRTSDNIVVKDSHIKGNKNDATVNKDVKPSKVQAIDNKFKKNVEITDDKLIVSDKDLLKREIDEIAHATDGTKKSTIPPVKKSTQVEKTSNTSKVTDGSPRASRKEKLLHAMSTPMESDKALRMMRLMGWEGGALGLRGEGIIEPIIPALDIVPGKGLGHEKGKAKPKQEKLSKVDNRMEFLKTIKHVLSNESRVKSAAYSVVLSKKETRCFKEIMYSINTRQYMSLTDTENGILAEIKKILNNEPDIFLDMNINKDTKLLTIIKSKHYAVETKVDKKKKHQLTKEVIDLSSDTIEYIHKESLKDRKIDFCSLVLDFVKSEERSMEVCFSVMITEKLVNFIKNLCSCINKRTALSSESLGKLSMDIVAHIKDCHLVAEFDSKRKRTVILRKMSYKRPHIDNECLKYVINKYTNSTIPDEKLKVNDNKDKENKPNAQNDKVVHKVTSSLVEVQKQNISVKNDISCEDNTAAYIVIDSGSSSDESDSKINDNEHKKNSHKSTTDTQKSPMYDDELNSNDKEHSESDCKEINTQGQSKETDFEKFPLSINNMKTKLSTFEDVDFRKIDRNSIQKTIDSLTLHNKKLEDDNVLHNKGIDINCNKLENKNLNINSKLKDIEQSELCDKVGVRDSKITNNSRKWYEHSDVCLVHEDNSVNLKHIENDNDKNCHDILLIESDIVGIELIKKKVQSHIENIDNVKDFLPVLKYQGVLDNGVVYSCHNKATYPWLKDVLLDYNVIDYRKVTKNHKVKIIITSFNNDKKKIFELLEIYNEGLKCGNWTIIFEKYFNYLFTMVVEMDDESLNYICSNNFSLFIGYGVAQFSIGL